MENFDKRQQELTKLRGTGHLERRRTKVEDKYCSTALNLVPPEQPNLLAPFCKCKFCILLTSRVSIKTFLTSRVHVFHLSFAHSVQCTSIIRPSPASAKIHVPGCHWHRTFFIPCSLKQTFPPSLVVPSVKMFLSIKQQPKKNGACMNVKACVLAWIHRQT